MYERLNAFSLADVEVTFLGRNIFLIDTRQEFSIARGTMPLRVPAATMTGGKTRN